MRAEVREALLAAYASSGMTQRAFAEREGVKYGTLTKWLLLQRRKPAAAMPPAFAEVRLNGGRAPARLRSSCRTGWSCEAPRRNK